MEQFKPPSVLVLEGNVSEYCKRWKQRFDLYLKASGADKQSEDVKVAILLHCIIGEDALEIFNTFKFDDDETEDERLRQKLDNVVQKFVEYCNPRKNTLFERYKFWQRSQNEGEKVDHFVTDLNRMVKTVNTRNPRTLW